MAALKFGDCRQNYFQVSAVKLRKSSKSQTHVIHVWYNYPNLPYKSTIHVGKYTINPMGKYQPVCPIRSSGPFSNDQASTLQWTSTWTSMRACWGKKTCTHRIGVYVYEHMCIYLYTRRAPTIVINGGTWGPCKLPCKWVSGVISLL